MSEKLTRLAAWAQARQGREEGQGIVEYGLVVGLVSIVIIATLATAGTGWITSISGNVTDAIG